MTAPTRSARLLEVLSVPWRRFVALEAASSLLLLGATVLALLLANSPFAGAYDHALHLPLAVRVGGFELELSLAHFVKDVLMTIFFFVVGMEIKRELVLGELSSASRAMLPVLAALGGMVVPAAFYAALHTDPAALRGWGIPMATDIAFAVAALSVFGARVPAGLKVFLLALAIADDIGAVTVIAVFYTESVSMTWLAVAAGAIASTQVLRAAGIRNYGVYAGVGALAWYAMLQSGVHATIAGVTLGLLAPAHAEPDEDESPIDELVHLLHPWVAFVIMPAFALCNAGVALDAATLGDPLAMRVAAAVALGLVVGKPLGVTLFAWAAVRLGVAELPRGVGWGQILGAGALAGIGFTVALFVASLAFGESMLNDGAKLGVLGGSVVATGLGLALLARVLPATPVGGPEPRPGATPKAP